MLRTIAVYLAPATIVAAQWLRLEEGSARPGDAFAVAAVALLPALLPAGWLRLLGALPATVAAAWIAFGVAPESGFARPVAERFRTGLEAYYEQPLPFSAGDQPLMHGVLVLAVFGFCLALALTVAARKPLLAVAALAAGAGWPATLLGGTGQAAAGAAILAVALVVLAGLRIRSASTAVSAALAVAVVVAAAAGASSSAALAKEGVLAWQSWRVGEGRPLVRVGVDYVWDANYGGIAFPEEETVVLRIEAPNRRFYWRATTLDEFADDHWFERLLTLPGPGEADPLAPDVREDDLVRQDVTVVGLRDDHLVAAATPIEFDTHELGAVFEQNPGVMRAANGLREGQAYTVWSYAPRPRPAELARVRAADYPREILGYLEVDEVAGAPFGTPAPAPGDGPYADVYREARRVAGGAASPYAAAVALEAWFRRTGGFRYDEQPPLPTGAPLAQFVLETKRGYCQHFAGAMALMLRYLGVPARVAAGFTSGDYDEEDGAWTVTDHDAHAWVEVWFPGYGWLPFDPTPGRGTLGGTYTTAGASPSPDTLEELERAAPGASAGLDPGGALGFGDGRPVPPPTGATGEDAPSLLRLLLLLGVLAVAALAGTKVLVRRARYLTRDPRRIAAAARHELADFLLDQGVAVGESATLDELRELAERELGARAAPFARAAAAARYGPPEDAAAAAQAARRELRRVLRAGRAHLSATRRVRGLLALRSLGFRS